MTFAAETPNWGPGPERPLLGERVLEVWRANLAAGASEVDELLCKQEKERARGLLSDRDRALWTRSRGILRALLGRYLQSEPAALRFQLDEHGKPALATRHSPSADGGPSVSRAAASCPNEHARHQRRLFFNLSHSGEVALYAFAPAAAVGVDVEVARPVANAVGIAERLLGASEAQRLQRLEPDTRQREFLRSWVRHEAKLKCSGVGISVAGRTAGEADRPWSAGIEVGPGAVAAVAAEQEPLELRLWEWR